MKVTFKLAEMLSTATGGLFEAHKFKKNDPFSRSRDGIAWDIWGVMPGGLTVRAYSFDTMSACVKGFAMSVDDTDIEIVANENPKE